MADGGSSATMRSKSSSVSEPTTNLDGMTCVLKRLGVSSAALEHVASTRALDGQQTEEWDGFKARWTFHPDDGLQMTVVDTKAG